MQVYVSAAANGSSNCKKSNKIYTWMLEGAKAQGELSSDEEGWVEVQRRHQRLRRVDEGNLYKPVAATIRHAHIAAYRFRP